MNTYKDFHAKISRIENECLNEVIALFEEHNVSSIELDTEDDDALILPMYGRYDGIENVTINSIEYKLVEVYGSEKMHIILGVEGYTEKFSLHEFDGNAILFVYDVVYNYFNNNK
jgi:hypothetical protein